VLGALYSIAFEQIKYMSACTDRPERLGIQGWVLNQSTS